MVQRSALCLPSILNRVLVSGVGRQRRRRMRKRMIYADSGCAATGLYGNAQVPGPGPSTTLAEFWARWKYNREDPASQRVCRTSRSTTRCARRSRARQQGGLLFPERRAHLLEPQRPSIDHRIGVERPDAAANDFGRRRERRITRGESDPRPTSHSHESWRQSVGGH